MNDGREPEGNYGNNSTGSRPVVRDVAAEWRAFDKLHPVVREILRESPFEFSTTDAQMVWDFCVEAVSSDSYGNFFGGVQAYNEKSVIAEFRRQMKLNIEAMLKTARSETH